MKLFVAEEEIETLKKKLIDSEVKADHIHKDDEKWNAKVGRLEEALKAKDEELASLIAEASDALEVRYNACLEAYKNVGYP